MTNFAFDVEKNQNAFFRSSMILVHFQIRELNSVKKININDIFCLLLHRYCKVELKNIRVCTLYWSEAPNYYNWNRAEFQIDCVNWSGASKLFSRF